MVKSERKVSHLLAALMAVIAMGVAPRAFAFPGGIATQNLGPLGCNGCHTGGQTPTVMLSGPTTVDPGSTNEYTLSISVVGAQNFGGCNVSAAFGTFAVGGANAAQTQTIMGPGGRLEITHTSPKPASGVAIEFSFLWTAPTSFTSVTFNAWGNAVNHDGTRNGDQAAFATLLVTSGMPGPNPTNTPTPTPAPTPTPVLHDAVVSPIQPITVTLPAGAPSISKTLSIKVTNADPKTQVDGLTLVLSATSDCPAGVIIPGPSFDGAGSVFLKAGQSKTAKTTVTISSDAFTTLNHVAAGRCTLTFVVSTSPASIDPNPSNNVVTAELNVIDKNDPDQATVDESFVQSLAPLKVAIPAGGTSIVKRAKATIGNADILPVPANPGDSIAVMVSDGDCPAGTMGPATPASVVVKGGKKQTVAVVVTVDSAQFATLSAKSPARCTALISAAGVANPDPDPTNNTSQLVIDVTDGNDF